MSYTPWTSLEGPCTEHREGVVASERKFTLDLTESTSKASKNKLPHRIPSNNGRMNNIQKQRQALDSMRFISYLYFAEAWLILPLDLSILISYPNDGM